MRLKYHGSNFPFCSLLNICLLIAVHEELTVNTINTTIYTLFQYISVLKKIAGTKHVPVLNMHLSTSCPGASGNPGAIDTNVGP